MLINCIKSHAHYQRSKSMIIIAAEKETDLMHWLKSINNWYRIWTNISFFLRIWLTMWQTCTYRTNTLTTYHLPTKKMYGEKEEKSEARFIYCLAYSNFIPYVNCWHINVNWFTDLAGATADRLGTTLRIDWTPWKLKRTHNRSSPLSIGTVECTIGDDFIRCANHFPRKLRLCALFFCTDIVWSPSWIINKFDDIATTVMVRKNAVTDAGQSNTFNNHFG